MCSHLSKTAKGGAARGALRTGLGRQQMPGFAIFLEAGGGAAGAERVEIQCQAAADLFGRDQVPDSETADEGGEEVDVSGGVGCNVPIAAPVAANGEGMVAVKRGGLHLDAPDTGASVHHDIVVFVVTERLSDRESAAGGLQHEVHFGEVANVFCVVS